MYQMHAKNNKIDLPDWPITLTLLRMQTNTHTLLIMQTKSEKNIKHFKKKRTSEKLINKLQKGPSTTI